MVSFLDFLKYEPNVVSKRACVYSGVALGVFAGLFLLICFVVSLVIGSFLQDKQAGVFFGLMGFVFIFGTIFLTVFLAGISGVMGYIFGLLYNKIPTKRVLTKYFVFSMAIGIVFEIFFALVLGLANSKSGIDVLLAFFLQNVILNAINAVLFAVFLKKFNKKSETAVAVKETEEQISGAEYADPMQRIGAYFVDAIAVCGILLLFVVLFSFIVQATDSKNLIGENNLVLAILCFFGILLVYSPIMIGTWQKTIGMHVMKIRVLRLDGSRVSYLRAFAREIAFRLLASVTIGISLAWAIYDSKKQCWHDKVVGTVVVTENSLKQIIVGKEKFLKKPAFVSGETKVVGKPKNKDFLLFLVFSPIIIILLISIAIALISSSAVSLNDFSNENFSFKYPAQLIESKVVLDKANASLVNIPDRKALLFLSDYSDVQEILVYVDIASDGNATIDNIFEAVRRNLAGEKQLDDNNSLVLAQIIARLDKQKYIWAKEINNQKWLGSEDLNDSTNRKASTACNGYFVSIIYSSEQDIEKTENLVNKMIETFDCKNLSSNVVTKTDRFETPVETVNEPVLRVGNGVFLLDVPEYGEVGKTIKFTVKDLNIEKLPLSDFNSIDFDGNYERGVNLIVRFDVLNSGGDIVDVGFVGPKRVNTINYVNQVFDYNGFITKSGEYFVLASIVVNIDDMTQESREGILSYSKGIIVK